MYKGNILSKNDGGFTLIELMISITILTLLLFTGSYMYSMLSSRWDKQLGNFSDNAKIAKNLEITQRVLEGVHAFIVVDNKQQPSFFFIGGEDSLLAVTYSGVFSENYPEIFRITSTKSANNKFDLVYQGASVKNILLLGTDQDITFEHQFTLFKDLDSIQYHYYGWPNFLVKVDRHATGNKMQWTTRYSGIDSQIMPEQFYIELTKAGSTIKIPVNLDPNTERLLSPYIEAEG